MDEPFLPFELIILILLRLPIKSIVRFQCVCKQWKNLFKTRSFISQYTLHSAHQNPFLLIHAYYHNHHRSTVRLLNQNMETTQVLNTHFIDSFRRDWTIIGSSNGFICVELSAEHRRSPTSYLMWNLVSNEVREIPPTLHQSSPSVVGFGYSSVVDDYKIVRFYYPHLLTQEQEQYFSYDMVYGVEVFSSRTGSWKELELGDLHYIHISSKAAANVNGTIFWYGCGSLSEMLIAFDIATEFFTLTSLDTFSANVDVQEYDHCPNRVFEYGSKLAMCNLATNYVNGEDKGYNIIMWVIEECGSESGKSYRCSERYKFGPILEDYVLQPTCFWRNEIVCPYIIRNAAEAENDERNYLHLFNLISKEWNKFPNFSGAYDRCTIFNYEKSLSASLGRLA